MRKWSEELVEDREFEIGGELFEWIYPHWEVGAKLFDDDLTPADDQRRHPGVFVSRRTRSLRSNGSRCSWTPRTTPTNGGRRWRHGRRTRCRRFQFVQLYRWLVQVTGGAPYDTALRLGFWGWGQRHRILGRVVLNGGDVDSMTPDVVPVRGDRP